MDGLIKTLSDRRTAIREELDLVERLLEFHERQVGTEAMGAKAVVGRLDEDAVSVRLNERSSEAGSGQPPRVTQEFSRIDVRPFMRKANGMGAVRDAAEAYLKGKGSRAESGEIYLALVRQGLLKKDDPRHGNITSYLGRAKKTFDNVRGKGYGLAEWSAVEKVR